MDYFGGRPLLCVLLAALFTGLPAIPASAQAKKETTKQEAEDWVVGQFGLADKNGDRQLSLEEYLVNRNPPEVARRDFLLMDWDADGSLTLAEFAAGPTVVEPWFRGPIPDPMTPVVDSIVAALDKALGNWNENPKREYDATGFAQAIFGRFGNIMTEINIAEVDPDRSGMVSRDEARRFLEFQLGVRRFDGKLLRDPNGRIVNYMLYLHVDQNRNDKLERAEFIERSYAGAAAEEEFKSANVNGDDSLSFAEWRELRSRGMTDPVLEFRQCDTNFDAFVTAEELIAGSPDWKRNLAKSAIPAFDLDGDGKLSLTEYRLTPHSNSVLPFQNELADVDGDNMLTIGDFKFEKELFPLLRLIYFHRLDTNANGKLDVTEFVFRVKIFDEFFTLEEDGTGWKSLFKFEGRPACGSPSVSPDGKQLAFDAWPLGQQNGSAIFLMDIPEGRPRQFCLGMMPSWSKDGHKLACSRGTPTYGAWLMDLEGEDHKLISRGWGAQWSPDGTRIAYTEGGPIIKTYDVKTEDVHTVFDGTELGYQQILWNMTWSPDSRRLCFKAIKPDGLSQVGIVNAAGDKAGLKVRYSTKHHINADFAWHPQGRRIVFAAFSEARKTTQLFEVDPDNNEPAILVRGQDETRNNTDACWMPDGKRLIVISGDY